MKNVVENMVNVNSYIENVIADCGCMSDNCEVIVDQMLNDVSLNVFDFIDYTASQDMEDADLSELRTEISNDYFYRECLEKVITDGLGKLDSERYTLDEHLRQGYFLMRKEQIAALIYDYNLVFVAILKHLSKKYSELTVEQVEYIEEWVDDQDGSTTLEDMIQFCDNYLLSED